MTGCRNKYSVKSSFQLLLVASVLVSQVAAIEHPLTLTAGMDGTIPFECSNGNQSDSLKYYTMTFEGKDRPFYLDGAVHPDGLMSPDQFERFRIEYVENDSVISIEIHIASVSLEDQGTYVTMLIILGEIPELRLMKQVVIIYIPPGPAACFLTLNESEIRPYEVHCHFKPGNGDSTLTCFQNNEKIPYQGSGDQILYRRMFWIIDTYAPVSCCAHDIKEIATITEPLCSQYILPPTQVTNNPDPTEKVPPEMALATGPSSNDKEKKPPSHTTMHSGCAQSLNIWQKAMLPLMAVVAYACMFTI